MTMTLSMYMGYLAASALDEIMGMFFRLVLVQDISPNWEFSISWVLHVGGELAAASFGYLASSGL